jgi:bifunctional non-homologous end joining protein LigD
MVFDVMRVDGKDVSDQPLGERRKILRGLGLEHSTWQVPDAYDDGPMLFEATLQQGLEGIVSKRLTSRYVFGQRTKSWLKFAHRHRRSYVVGGWRPQEGTADRLAALLVGEPTEQGLVYRGRVGSGIGAAASRQLTQLVTPLSRGDSPFDDEVPVVDARGTFWVDPVLVVDIETHGVGYQRLRQPAYQGVRTDLRADDLGRGEP